MRHSGRYGLSAVAWLVPAVALGIAVAQGRAEDGKAVGPKPQILIVGTYHMANPGHDVFNIKADDVLAPKRQAEIAEMAAVLKKFRPTRIAVESAVATDKVKKQYADYLAGRYTLTGNEIDQLGYRLAKELGLGSVDPVDCEGDFPLQRVANFARAAGASSKYEEVKAGVGVMVKEQAEFLRSHTVLETLLYLNADGLVAEDVGYYYRLAHFGEPEDYAGPDLLSSWYQRNIRIYNNIINLIGSPNERILVIYGVGHLGWLRLAAESDPTVRLRKLAEFVPSGQR